MLLRGPCCIWARRRMRELQPPRRMAVCRSPPSAKAFYSFSGMKSHLNACELGEAARGNARAARRTGAVSGTAIRRHAETTEARESVERGRGLAGDGAPCVQGVRRNPHREAQAWKGTGVNALETYLHHARCGLAAGRE